MKLHLESPAFDHPIAQYAPKLVTLQTYNITTRAQGQSLVAALRANGGWCHLGQAEKAITEGLDPDEAAFGIVNNCLSYARFVQRCGPAIGAWVSAGILDINPYVNAEFIPNSNAPDSGPNAPWPVLWAKLRQRTGLDNSFSSDQKLNALSKAAVYGGMYRGLAAMGVNPNGLFATGCWDREVGWTTRVGGDIAVPCAIGRCALLYTTPDAATTNRIDGELSGHDNSRVVCHLASSTPPEVNRARLVKFLHYGVGDVVLYADVNIPEANGGNAILYGKTLVEVAALQASVGKPRLDAHLPVFRDFAQGGPA